MAFQTAPDVFNLYWLGQERIDPRAGAFVAGFFHCIRRYGDDRHVIFAVFSVTNGTCQREAVHIRHAKVSQYKVISVLSKLIEGQNAVVRGVIAAAQFTQNFPDHNLVYVVIFHDENMQLRAFRLAKVNGRVMVYVAFSDVIRRFCQRKRDSQCEGGAMPFFT
nr:hypothetical protein [Kordiimonas aestuarii]